MIYASSDLIQEHQGVLHGLSILQQIADIALSNREVDSDDCHEMISFLQLFADKCHHGKEEGILFPALEEIATPAIQNLLDELLEEHKQGRSHIVSMSAALVGERVDQAAFSKAAIAYIDLLRSHIDREDSLLFPASDKLLPTQLHQELLERFEAHEELVMGKGTHEQLHEILHRLGEKYKL